MRTMPVKHNVSETPIWIVPYGETLIEREPDVARVYLLWMVTLLDNGDIDRTKHWGLCGVYDDLETLKRECPGRGLNRDFAAQEWMVNGQAKSEMVWWQSWAEDAA